jgi:hypothetical protein
VLADNSGNLYYGMGSLIVDSIGQFYYPDGNMLTDIYGNLYASNGQVFLTSSNQLELADGTNVIVGTTDGSSFGNSTASHVSVYGVQPVAQRTSSAQAAVATTTPTNVSPYGYTLAQATAIITLVNELRAALVAFGIIKGS